MKPPIAKREAYLRTLHGETWTDHYHWLRADNWQECVDDPGALPAHISDYLNAENAWFDHCLSDTKHLQAQLVAEMRGRILDVDQSLPDEEGGWCYVERYEQGDEYPRYFRYPRDTSAEDAPARLLIDFNLEAEHHEYFDPGDVEYSPSHTHLAWSADTQGSERYQLRIRNMSTGIDEDTIDDVYGVTWGNADYLFYTRVDADYRPSCVYRHRLGTPSDDDVLVFEETDKRFYCSVWTSLSGRYVFIGTDMNDQSEVWYIDTVDIKSPAVVIEPRTDNIEYSVEHQGARFLILTNADGAQDFKIVSTSCESPGRAYWKDWRVHKQGVMVLDLYAYRDWVMWLERENALPRICFCRASESAEDARVLDFDQEAYALSLEPLVEFDQSVFRVSFESPSTPARTYRFDMENGSRVLLKEDILPCGHNKDDYVVRRLFAPALDGQSVPVTLLYHKDTLVDGSAPCLLSAYGAYGSSVPADFSSSSLSLVDRGFVVAIAHVRGGQEKGRAWYDAARGAGKQNTFDDVVAVARHLIKTAYTGAGKIILSGGSAGGLMVGAVINQTTDLWAGAIADVPFVDALNTLIDESLPLTPGEWTQWGNPIDNRAAFDVIRRYSPYDNIKDRPYPPLLVTAGVSDPRVTYWEPAKWVARHRHVRNDNTLLVFKVNMSSGHFGVSGRYASLQDEAIEQAFALKVIGLDS
ncbi:MAG: S9 family peptidase [Granulosicoccus sp.]